MNTQRIRSIDILRGAVMVLMAIDHVRVYAGVPAGGPTAGVFFTRWITNFCAPVFVFLAGTSAYLYARRHDDLPRFLLTRGLWLIFLELTVLRVAWSFHFDLMSLQMAGVIWVIGCCMILMAGLSRLPLIWTTVIGLLIVCGHNLFDGTMQRTLPQLNEHSLGWLWKILYVGPFAGPDQLGSGDAYFIVLYSIVPWVGVMACGHAFARILQLEAARRDRACLVLGLGATGFFVILRIFDLYGDPRGWHDDGLLAFLNTSKYPASLQFLLMTLGPAVALMPLLEGLRGRIVAALELFGRVPFFFYMLHIPLIHLLAIVVSLLRGHAIEPWLIGDHPLNPGPVPEGYTWSLGLLYSIWAVALLLLWISCRWFAGLKARRRDAWLRYL